ncbi:YfhD protein [Bacillus sp. B-jedd]|nr:YfhD protein [Bacillus sp. B-jedd]
MAVARTETIIKGTFPLYFLKGVIVMARSRGHRNRDKNTSSLPQTPKNLKITDGRDVEFDRDLADHDDLEAMARSKAADQRAKSRK